MINRATIAKNIRRVMGFRLITQAELGARIGVDQRHLTNMLKHPYHRLTDERVAAIAEALGVNVDMLQDEGLGI